jgi:hypothetical protein
MANVNTFAKRPSSKAGLITRFSFSLLHGGIVVMKATIGNFPDTLNFMLDTGCEGVSLDSTTAENLGLVPTVSRSTIKGIAQLKQAKFIYNQTFRLPHLAIDSFEYHINDYTFLKHAHGIKIDGVIGYSLLKNFVVRVDYDKRIIEVWKQGTLNYPKGGSVMTLDNPRLPMFNASIKDKHPVNTSYIFDTGGDICVLLSDSFVSDSNFLSADKKMIEVPAAGPGGTQMMKFIAIPEVRIGQFTFKNVPSLIFKDQYNVTRYPKTGGIIGNELLHRFNLIINYADAQIHLTPNSYLNEPFNYTYNGFDIVDAEGQAVIKTVVKNSLAEKAGLQTGDIVFGINDNFSKNISDLNDVIASARKQLKIVVLRNNQLKNIVVAVDSVL